MKNILLILVIFITPDISAQLNNKYIDSIIRTVQISKDNDSVRARKLTNFAAKNRYTKKTLSFIKAAETIANKTSNPLVKSDVLLAYGNYYFYNSELNKAKMYYRQTTEMLEKAGNPLLLATAIYSLAGVYKKEGNVSLNIETLLKSKKILDKINEDKLDSKQKRFLYTRKIILYNALANFYNLIEDFDKAIFYYDEAFDKAIQIKPAISAGIILSNKGELLVKTGAFDKALEAYQKSLEIKINGGASKITIANSQKGLANLLYKMKKNEQALNVINTALSQYEKFKDVSGLNESLIIRGNIYLALQQYDKAEKDCLRAQQMAKKKGLLEFQKDAALCLYQIYKNTGKYKEALENSWIYYQAKDSLFNEKNIKQITRMETEYAYEKEKQKQELINQAREREAALTIKGLIAGLVMLLIIAAILLYFNNLRKKKNALLKDKNQQISEALMLNETLMKETHHRVKNNLQIISSLLNMQSQYLSDKKSKDIVADSQNRIRSMSLIHQHLYQGEKLTSIESDTYFNKLIDSLASSYGIDPSQVKMRIDIEKLLLDVDTAIPLGLILNELISNAFKYGVDKKTGEFSFEFKQNNQNELEVVIKDNGTGLPEDFDIKNTGSYGMKLVQILSQKLKADIRFVNDKGLSVRMKIKKYKIAA